jgi:hypothetical protein
MCELPAGVKDKTLEHRKILNGRFESHFGLRKTQISELRVVLDCMHELAKTWHVQNYTIHLQPLKTPVNKEHLSYLFDYRGLQGCHPKA